MTHALSNAMERLATIVRSENAALAALDFNAALALLGSKHDAIGAFEAASKGGARPDEADLARLRDAALDNTALLERAIRVQRRVIETVLASLPPQDAPPRYCPNAAMARARRTAPMTLLARA